MKIEELIKNLDELKSYLEKDKNARLYDSQYGLFSIADTIDDQKNILEELKNNDKKFDFDTYKEMMVNFQKMTVNVPHLSGPVNILNETINAIKDADISGEKNLFEILDSYEPKEIKDFVKIDYVMESMFEINVKSDSRKLNDCSKTLDNSKKGVWGKASPQFTKMENLLKEVSEMEKNLDKSENNFDKSENYNNYIKKLNELKESADAYIEYKSKKEGLKDKEKIRIDAAKKIADFAKNESDKFRIGLDDYQLKIDTMTVAKAAGSEMYDREVKNFDESKTKKLSDDISFAKKYGKDNKELSETVRSMMTEKSRLAHSSGTYDIVAMQTMTDALSVLSNQSSNAQEEFDKIAKGLLNEPVKEETILGNKEIYNINFRKSEDYDTKTRINGSGALMIYMNSKTELDKEFLKSSFIMESILNSKVEETRDKRDIEKDEAELGRIRTPREQMEKDLKEKEKFEKKQKEKGKNEKWHKKIDKANAQKVVFDTKVDISQLSDIYQTGYYGFKTIREIGMKGLEANDKLYNHSSNDFSKKEKEELLSDLILYRMTDQEMRSENNKEKKEYIKDLNDLNPLVKRMGQMKDPVKTRETLKNYIKSTDMFKQLMSSEIKKEDMNLLCSVISKKTHLILLIRPI